MLQVESRCPFLPPRPSYMDFIRTILGSNILDQSTRVGQRYIGTMSCLILRILETYVDSDPQQDRTNPYNSSGTTSTAASPRGHDQLLVFECITTPATRWFDGSPRWVYYLEFGPASPRQHLHFNRLFDNIAPGTETKLWSRCRSFFRRCMALQVNLVSRVLADILIPMSLSGSTSHSSSSCSSVIKALRWLVKAADVGCRQAIDRHHINRCQACQTGACLSILISLDQRSSGLSTAQRP